MNPILKNILAIIIGCMVGNVINMAIIMLSSSIIPPPEGADITTIEGLKAAIPLFRPKHFILPFLAHALGAFSGAFITAKLAANHKMKFALGIGIFFLIGGIINALLLSGPTWFTVLDLLAAYVPTSYLGGKLALQKK